MGSTGLEGRLYTISLGKSIYLPQKAKNNSYVIGLGAVFGAQLRPLGRGHRVL